MILGRNLNLHKGIENTRNDKYVNKYKTLSCYLKFSFKDSWLFKPRTITNYKFVTYTEVKCKTTINDILGQEQQKYIVVISL